MKTYMYMESDSPIRGCNVRITAWRLERNVPRCLGHSDHSTAAWYGARPCAMQLISGQEHIPMDDSPYKLKGLLGFDKMYTTTSGKGIRLYSIGVS